MGTWGSKTFENDTALDELGDTVEGLLERLSADLDEIDDGLLERPTIALISILRCLAAEFPAAKDMIEAEQVASWRDRYLAWMDANKEEFGATEKFLSKYRANAASEFESLLAAIRQKRKKR